jgi:pimeloyl-ACP methyl ester carboxylesterase
VGRTSAAHPNAQLAARKLSVARGSILCMTQTTSADGTSIAYHQFGSGRPVIVVGGALSTAASGRPLAEAFGAAGLQGVCWDRRGRGDSGDTAPYAPEREVEDLRAVVGALGGDAVVLGHSAGAVLALLAAGAGVPMRHLFVSEPVLRFGEDEPPADLADRLQTLVDAGRLAEALVTFQRENVRLTEAQIEALMREPSFPSLVRLAQTTVYDTQLVASVSTPTPEMLGNGIPTTILRGEPAAPVLVAACERLAAAMPGVELVVVPESQHHRVDPSGTVREVLARLGSDHCPAVPSRR